MHSHIGYICSIFLHCAFSNVSSKRLHKRMQSHIGCICLTFPHCVFSNEPSNCLSEKRHSHIGCIWLTFLHCVFSNVSANCLPEKMQSHIGCICQSFFQEYSYLHLSNQSQNFLEFGPLSVVICPIGCFKLRQIYDCLFIPNNHFHFPIRQKMSQEW